MYIFSEISYFLSFHLFSLIWNFGKFLAWVLQSGYSNKPKFMEIKIELDSLISRKLILLLHYIQHAEKKGEKHFSPFSEKTK